MPNTITLPPNVPAVNPRFTDQVVKYYPAFDTYSGPVDFEITRLPNIIPNFGIPGTGINVSRFMMSNLVTNIEGWMRSYGHTPLILAVRQYENVQPGPIPNLLGYEIRVLVVGQRQAMTYGYVAGEEAFAEPFIQIAGLAAALLVIFGGIALWAVIDRITGGAATQSFKSAADAVFHGTAQVAGAPAGGATNALLLFGAVGAIFVLGLYMVERGLAGPGQMVALPSLPGFPGIAQPAVSGGVTTPVGPARVSAGVGVGGGGGGGGRAPSRRARR